MPPRAARLPERHGRSPCPQEEDVAEREAAEAEEDEAMAAEVAPEPVG